MQHRDGIRYYHRDRGQLETEAIYGESFLRWAYETGLGRVSLHTLVKRPFFSRWYGWAMDRPRTARMVAPFVERFGLDPDEFEKPLPTFRSFNDFFYRRLKPEARPICPEAEALVFPADGRHTVFPDLSEDCVFPIKGFRFDLERLLGAPELAATFQGGSAILSRLCPTDYHRFHFAAPGSPEQPRSITGPFYSVSPIALARRPSILWENHRVLTSLTSERWGRVLILEIGATNVGSIMQTFPTDRPVRKGEEKGYFAFGGSATLYCFERGRVQFDPDLIDYSEQGIEVYALMGQRMGQGVR